MLSYFQQTIHTLIWGPVMIFLLLGVGLLFTIGTKGLQFRRFATVLRLVFPRRGSVSPDTTSLTQKKTQPEAVKRISSFQAATTSLAGALGTGNIVGVATTLVVGGPGAIVWMWVSALLGMMTKYAEIVLAVHYQSYNDAGEPVGGPMYYMEKGLGIKSLAVTFAVLGAIASFGIGNIAQVNAISDSFQSFLPIRSQAIGLAVALLVGIVMIGGIQRIASVSSIGIPFFAGLYFLGAIIILVINAPKLPATFALILSDAFQVKAVGGGILGYFVTRAMRFGIARGVFSHEAGMGSACFAHAATENHDPVQEGLWGIFEVFFDTIVMCSLTAFVILTTGVLDSGADGALLTAKAFETVFPATIVKPLLAISISFFAFATLMSWSYYGEKCLEYLTPRSGVLLIYKFLFLVMIVLGATMKLSLVWGISDTLNGAMAIPNLIALILLSPVVFRLTKGRH